MKNNKTAVYTIANAHLDTSWLWTLEQSISEYIPDTLRRNFEFFEKYPEYKFNFEGSYRYELLKEYYPDDFEKVREYIKEGRWNPCGACYENGDVNIPSPEALIRNIIYGNGFFRKEFGTESNDIFLPDCFGFGKALPTVAAHCGLTGFSTGKLFWGSSVPIPFDIGKWKGIDGNGVWAALMPFSYTTVFGDIRKSERILNKIADNKKNNRPDFTFAYHGIGDRGGAPHKTSVKNVIKAQRSNQTENTEVYSATTKEFFDMIENLPEDEKKKLPEYSGEFLLTAHGAGSYTSRTVTKRWNRRSELLADAAERFAGAAFSYGLSQYPQYGLDDAWKRVIAHHFHDDITGTSFEECYKRSHNDYIRAMNTFSAEYTAACKNLSAELDTSFVTGIPVVVSNPLQTSSQRKEAVKVRIDSASEHFRVFDKNGKEVPSQTKTINNGEKEITFIATVLSCGLAVYDIREAAEKSDIRTELSINEEYIGNKYLSIKIDKNGDICSIFDKRLNKELLKKPVRMAVYNNVHSVNWPAWEIKYEDLCEAPYMYASSPEFRITDNGPALCSLEIIRTAGKSKFTQIISLDSESEFLSVYNETDWREEASLLKAEFAVAPENDYASYDIGIGFTKRPTNTKELYEVPAQKWADITDENGEFGVAVFSDSRTGWDKPDKSTLRLTVVHTPMTSYRWECSQHVMDMGLNRYSFAIMGHKGTPDSVSPYADSFCQPMHTFITDKHEGSFGKEFSFVSVNNDNVRITAIKKAQDTDRIVIRLCDFSGKNQNGIEVRFSKELSEAYEIRGDETELTKAAVKDGKLCFDMTANGIRSFAVEFKSKEKPKNLSAEVPLNFNAVGITSDKNCSFSTLKNGYSVPKELLPEEFMYAGINYRLSRTEKNCLVCDGSTISVEKGFAKLHLLLLSLGGDKTVKFESGGKITEVTVPCCFEPLGHWDLMQAGETGYIKPYSQALTVSHTHSKNGNLTAKQIYLFHAEIPLNGNNSIKLPDDRDIVIFSAVTEKESPEFIKGDEHYDTLDKRNFDYEFSAYAKKRMRRAAPEYILDIFINRASVMNIKAGEFYNKYAFNEAYYIIRSLCDRITYKKKAQKVTENRKNCR